MTFEEADRRYPYDPKARESDCRGLEKLRLFEKPGMRRAVYQTYQNVQAKHPAAAFDGLFSDGIPEDDSERRHP